MSNSTKSLFFASLLNGAAFLAVSAAAPPNPFNQGVAEYGKGHFTVARDYFRKVLKSQPRSQAAHYYLANTLAQLRDYAGALKEYEAGYDVNPDSDIAASCLEAMTNLKDYSSEGKPPTAAVKTTPAGKAVDEDSVIDATRMIRTQLEKESAATSTTADQYAKLRQEHAKAEAKRIQDEMQRKLDDIPVYRRGGYSRTQMQQSIKDEAAKQTQAEMARAQAEADYYAKAAKDRQATLTDVQASLESQLKNPGKTQLVPQGTNMYIRNYVHESQSTGNPATTPPKTSP